MSLLTWLKEEKAFPKFYFCPKGSSVEYAACGAKQFFYALDTLPHMRCYGGISFFSESWKDFPECCFFLPEEERIGPYEQKSSSFTNKVIFQRHLPEESDWHTLVEGCLNREYEKVVIARRSTYLASEAIDPYALLSALPEANRFLVQFVPETAFIGASPERLYVRKKNHIYIDALAGTKPLDEILLGNPKEIHEFQLVKQSILQAMKPFCDTCDFLPEDQIFKTSYVQHFYNMLTGELKEGLTDADLIKALHPTAALGGMPRDKALSYIRAHEPFVRGWYGAPLGFISKEDTQLAVGIRSALVRGKEIDLFAGTGIVAGSKPENEWRELDQKTALFRRIIV